MNHIIREYAGKKIKSIVCIKQKIEFKFALFFNWTEFREYRKSNADR